MNCSGCTLENGVRDSNYDVFLVGVGGQGIVTLGHLIAEAAVGAELPVNLYPTKGMAQRGGTVTVQVRLGREIVGPEIPEGRADLVIAMERSEALRAVRYIKPGADFVLYGQVWEPAKVMLGKGNYPTLVQVKKSVRDGRAVLHYLDPAELVAGEAGHAPPNIYTLGAAVGLTRLGRILGADTVAKVVAGRWERYASVNVAAFRAGLGAGVDEP